jgi:hypothetical protein
MVIVISFNMTFTCIIHYDDFLSTHRKLLYIMKQNVCGDTFKYNEGFLFHCCWPFCGKGLSVIFQSCKDFYSVIILIDKIIYWMSGASVVIYSFTESTALGDHFTFKENYVF